MGRPEREHKTQKIGTPAVTSANNEFGDVDHALQISYGTKTSFSEMPVHTFHLLDEEQHEPLKSVNSLHISDEGIKSLMLREGFKTHLYKDTVDKWTIGVGHLVTTGEERESFKNGISKSQVLELLRTDIERFETAIKHDVKVSLTQSQFDGLVSFVFNVGISACHGSKSTLLKQLNASHHEAVPGEMAKWVYETRHGQKVKSEQKVKRRQLEGAAFTNQQNAGQHFQQMHLLDKDLTLKPDIDLQQLLHYSLLDQLKPDVFLPALLLIELELTAPQSTDSQKEDEEDIQLIGQNSEAKKASPGDLLKAFLKIPEVSKTLDAIRRQVVKDINGLSADDKAILYFQLATITSGSIAAILSNESMRMKAMEIFNNRPIPVPGINWASFQLNITDKKIEGGIFLDVGALLPKSFGFRPTAPPPLSSE